MSSDGVPFSIVAIVIGSAFVHAMWNAILKRQKHPELAGGAISLIGAVSSVLVALFFTRTVPSFSVVLWSLGAGLFEAAYFVALSKALARAPLGVAYTIARGGALLVTWPISVVWHGERPTPIALVGSFLVAGGLALVGLRSGGKKAERHAERRAGLAWSIACAVFIAGYHLFYKCAMNAGGEPAPVSAVSLALAAVLSLAWYGRVGTAKILLDAREHPWPIVIAGLLVTVSFVAFLAGLERGGAGVIMTLRNTSVLFAQVFGWLGGERSRPAQVAGVLAVFAGAVCTAWH
ncbi:DMT family transporter [Pendulispora brunnea]|uniref:DMT family transporter n=1 Tax=Pendulispora brunnea TaxID=2905690 RepID=A0ABZ2K3X0_9BACT